MEGPVERPRFDRPRGAGWWALSNSLRSTGERCRTAPVRQASRRRWWALSNSLRSTGECVERQPFDRCLSTARCSIGVLSNCTRSTGTYFRDFPRLATTFAIFHKNNINSQKISKKASKRPKQSSSRLAQQPAHRVEKQRPSTVPRNTVSVLPLSKKTQPNKGCM